MRDLKVEKFQVDQYHCSDHTDGITQYLLRQSPKNNLREAIVVTPFSYKSDRCLVIAYSNLKAGGDSIIQKLCGTNALL
jgi:hypothetical protein